MESRTQLKTVKITLNIFAVQHTLRQYPFSYKYEPLWIAYYQIGSGFSARLSGGRRQDI